MGASWYRWDGDDLVIRLRVAPRAGKNEIVGPYADALKVRVSAAPVEGAANAHLLEWFAKLCNVPKARVTLEAGDKGRNKRIRIRAPARLIAGVERD